MKGTTVFGYIRSLQSVYKLNVIPPLVLHTCLAFYFEMDHFVTTDKAKEIYTFIKTIKEHVLVYHNLRQGEMYLVN